MVSLTKCSLSPKRMKNMNVGSVNSTNPAASKRVWMYAAIGFLFRRFAILAEGSTASSTDDRTFDQMLINYPSTTHCGFLKGSLSSCCNGRDNIGLYSWFNILSQTTLRGFRVVLSTLFEVCSGRICPCKYLEYINPSLTMYWKVTCFSTTPDKDIRMKLL